MSYINFIYHKIIFLTPKYKDITLRYDDCTEQTGFTAIA
jgi:hypothetical protein